MESSAKAAESVRAREREDELEPKCVASKAEHIKSNFAIPEAKEAKSERPKECRNKKKSKWLRSSASKAKPKRVTPKAKEARSNCAKLRENKNESKCTKSSIGTPLPKCANDLADKMGSKCARSRIGTNELMRNMPETSGMESQQTKLCKEVEEPSWRKSEINKKGPKQARLLTNTKNSRALKSNTKTVNSNLHKPVANGTDPI